MRGHALAIIVVHLLLGAGATYLIANHLPLRADFSYLLPQDAPSVVDLRKLEARVKTSETVLVVVQAPSPEVRAAAVAELVAGFRALPRELVEQVEADDAELRAFLGARRHLLVPLEDLERARAALAEQIEAAKLKANPLFLDLGDLDDADPEAEAKARAQLEQLQARRREAEARLDRSGNVSADGRTAVIHVRAPFRATDAGRGQALQARLGEVRARVTAAHPGVAIGFTGSVMTAVAEHVAIASGMLWSTIITTALVGLMLALYLRSALMLGLLVGTLGVATVIAFGLAALTVGHLNAASAFLAAIVAGNGVNYGILLIARFLEERRRTEDPDEHREETGRGIDEHREEAGGGSPAGSAGRAGGGAPRGIDEALAAAVAGTLRPTIIASLGAVIAYGSLAATSFRGFADFALIGALGMIVCWLASFSLLPALLLRFGHRAKVHAGTPIVGGILARLFGFERPRVVCAVALAVAVAASVIAVGYVADDPFEYDIKQLRSEGTAAVEVRRWMELSDQHFGRGLSGRTYIAADRHDQVPKIVKALRARDVGLPPEAQTIGAIQSILDVVPERQADKLAVLAELRALIDEATAVVEGDTRAELLALRPPDDLAPITRDALPPSLRDRLAEKNGEVGLLIAIRPADHLDEWNGRDLIRFARAVSRIELDGGETVTTSGASVIFADIVQSLERDGPIVTGVAALALVIVCLALIGPNRRALAVLVATGAGALLLVAVCALIGLKINFLDFMALPITLGLGIDYAINVAHRYDEHRDAAATLRTSGSAVFICSLTTIIAYGSLLASDNLAIRGFGTAALIGEITCVFTALVLVPALLGLGRTDPRLPPVGSSPRYGKCGA